MKHTRDFHALVIGVNRLNISLMKNKIAPPFSMQAFFHSKELAITCLKDLYEVFEAAPNFDLYLKRKQTQLFVSDFMQKVELADSCFWQNP